MVQSPDGGYVIAGSYLVKIDSSGNVQWNKTYGGGSVVLTSDGGYAIAGSSSFANGRALGQK